MRTSASVSHTRLLVVIATILAFGAKIYCAWTTIGTNDAVFFRWFGSRIEKVGLVEVYQTIVVFNHTPLVGAFCAWGFRMESLTGIQFPFFLRLAGIVADVGSVFALLWLNGRIGNPRLWLIGLFALSPVSFMVSGYHGNLDPVLTFFLLLAACACVDGRWVCCAIAFGFACHIKVVAFLISPALFFYWWPRGKAWHFAGIAGVVVLGGWVEPLVECPLEFIRNVLGYQSYWGIWGVTWALRSTGFEAFGNLGFVNLNGIQVTIMSGLKYLLITLALWIAWRRRRSDAAGLFATVSLIWAAFFTFAPGVGAQYLVWFAPFVLVFSPRWYLGLTAASTIFLFAFYNAISGGMPWCFGLSNESKLSGWVTWTMLPWVVMGAYFIYGWKSLMTSPARCADIDVQATPQLLRALTDR